MKVFFHKRLFAELPAVYQIIEKGEKGGRARIAYSSTPSSKIIRLLEMDAVFSWSLLWSLQTCLLASFSCYLFAFSPVEMLNSCGNLSIVMLLPSFIKKSRNSKRIQSSYILSIFWVGEKLGARESLVKTRWKSWHRKWRKIVFGLPWTRVY